MNVDYNALTEDAKIDLVSRNGYMIQHIRNPSEEIKLAAVKKEGSAIGYIQNPSETVQLAAVTKNCRAIQYIKSPSEAVCMAAINQSARAIHYIKTPPQSVKIEAIKFNPEAIGYLLAPTLRNRVRAAAEQLLASFIEPYKPINDVLAATLLIHHPLFPQNPKNILDRAPEILEAYCHGLGDVYTIGLSIGMGSEELSRTMQEWIENHAGVAAVTEMAP